MYTSRSDEEKRILAQRERRRASMKLVRVDVLLRAGRIGRHEHNALKNVYKVERVYVTRKPTV